MFQYAMQNPLFVSVSALVAADAPALSSEPMSWQNWDRLDASFARHRFFVDFRRCADGDAVLPADPTSVQILGGLSFDGALFAQTRFDPVPLQVFLDHLPAATSSAHEGQDKRARAETTDKDAIIKSLPWLSKVWKCIGRSQEAPPAEPGIAVGGGQAAQATADLHDDELAAIFEELERRRRVLVEDDIMGGDSRPSSSGAHGPWTIRVSQPMRCRAVPPIRWRLISAAGGACPRLLGSRSTCTLSATPPSWPGGGRVAFNSSMTGRSRMTARDRSLP